jgi:hypothetical protein
MRWRKTLDAATALDAYETAKALNLFSGSLRAFKALPRTRRTLTVAGFARLGVENAGAHRYQRRAASSSDIAALAARAYPPRDRPRGEADLASVAFLAGTRRAVSPVVVFRTARRRVLLDGVHRLVAASILGVAVDVIFVTMSPVKK